MRTAIRPQSVLRHPFSVIFGTEAAVRVLRELSRSGHERAPAFLAERTGVTIQTVRRTLAHLVTLGVVDVCRPRPLPLVQAFRAATAQGRH